MATPAGMDCVGLALEWEQNPDVRDRLRTKKTLLVHGENEDFCSPNRQNAVSNAIVLGPVLERISRDKEKKLPHLDDMQIEVTRVMEKCGLNAAEKQVYTASVELKRLASFMKRRVRR